MIILSKEAGTRIESGRELLASIHTHTKTLGEALEQTFSPDVAAKTLDVVGIIAEAVREATDGLAQAEHDHSVELGQDGPARKRRDAAYVEVRDDLKALGGAAESGHGADAPVVLGLDGPLPTRAADLHRFAQGVVHAARTKQLPPARFPGAVDITPIVDQLAIDTDELGEGLAGVARETKETETTLLAKHGSMDRFDGVFTATATLISALLAIAGERELSRRIRPSTRRPGRTVGKAREIADGAHVPEDEALPVPDPAQPAPAAGNAEDVA